MFKANCYNVMIVSPSDISKERKIVMDVLYKWNEINSRFHQIVFSVLGYDVNAHADSGMHPQESLNHQLLEQADLIIALFWTKLGSPTTEYSSGSVEEISKHMEAKKKAWLYFSNKPIPPDSINTKQYKKLRKYRKSVEKETFYRFFDSEKDFRKKLANDLQLFANELITTKMPSDDSSNIPQKKTTKITNNGMLSNKILEILKEKNDSTIAEIVNKLGISNRTARLNIQRLKDSKKIERVGNTHSGYWIIH